MRTVYNPTQLWIRSRKWRLAALAAGAITILLSPADAQRLPGANRRDPTVILTATAYMANGACRVALIADNETGSTLSDLMLKAEVVADRLSHPWIFAFPTLGNGLRQMDFAFIPMNLCALPIRIIVREVSDCGVGNATGDCSGMISTAQAAGAPARGVRPVTVEYRR